MIIEVESFFPESGQLSGETVSAQQNLNHSAASQGLWSNSVFTPFALSDEKFELLYLMMGCIFTMKIPVLLTVLFLTLSTEMLKVSN